MRQYFGREMGKVTGGHDRCVPEDFSHSLALQIIMHGT